MERTAPMGGAPRELPQGLIPASKLPSAAEALAELFAEPPAVEEPQYQKAAQPEKIAEPTAEEPGADAAPKRRNIFARLLTFKRPPATIPERLFPVEQSSAEESASEARAETQAETSTDASAVMEAAERGEAVNAEIDSLVETLGVPIPAETLPSAAAAFEEIFPPEETSVEPVAGASAEVHDEENEDPDEEAQEEDSAEAFSEVPV
ncbi:MAG: hypothetical protein P4L00_06610, partial [Candidatus Acidoferrales bacterium]|nr:hypothetical protein [Candidatus Acidoferrales bacterium]